MGAAHSTVCCDSWGESVPRYQLVRLGASEMHRLIVPDAVVHGCQLSAGQCVYMEDCLGRTFRVSLEKNGSVYSLSAGWAKMMERFGCRCGDEVMLRFKGANTWEVHVFDRNGGTEKFPILQEKRSGPSAGCSLRGDVDGGVERYGRLGSMTRPIILDGPNTDEIVYNATGRQIRNAMHEFFTTFSSTFGLEVALYYTKISQETLDSDCWALNKEYAQDYIVPKIQRVGGCPWSVLLFLNGSDAPFRVRFAACMSEGTVTLEGGISSFLRYYTFPECAELVLHFVWQGVDINIHVYEF